MCVRKISVIDDVDSAPSGRNAVHVADVLHSCVLCARAVRDERDTDADDGVQIPPQCKFSIARCARFSTRASHSTRTSIEVTLRNIECCGVCMWYVPDDFRPHVPPLHDSHKLLVKPARDEYNAVQSSEPVKRRRSARANCEI